MSTHRGSAAPKGAASAEVLLSDDFATERTGWTDDAHQAAGTYTGGAYRLSVTGYNGQNEVARPSSAGSGLSGVTPMNVDASVDVRTLSGAAQGYGLGLAFRGDGNGDLYAFLIEDHAVAIQKWVATGARLPANPPRSASAACTWARPAGCGPWSRPSTAARRSTSSSG